MKGIIKYIVARTYRPLLVKYLSKTRTYSYRNITLEIPSGVFHPGFFFSTKLLLRYISKQHLRQKSFLELGAGSGLLSIYAAKQGAFVVATDINEIAVSCISKNVKMNEVKADIILSDLFDKVPVRSFDILAINPPYYKKNPVFNSDHAWYCGEKGEYFEKLFKSLKNYMHERSDAFMVLCDGCDLKMIDEFAKKNFLKLECVQAKATMLEKNFIFKIQFAK